MSKNTKTMGMTRRQFALAGTASSVIAGARAWPGQAPISADPACGAVHLVVDQALVDKGVLSDESLSPFPARYRFRGDVSTLWQDTLLPLWRARREMTFGITRHAEFFLLHTLAREAGYELTASEERDAYASWMLAPARPPLRG